MAYTEEEIQSLQTRVIELERQLAEAHAAIQVLTPPHGDIQQPGLQGQAEVDTERLLVGEAAIRRAMAVDVTEHKQVEEALRAARDQATWLARFPGENPNPVIRVSNEGNVLYCNPPAASVRGWRCAVNTVLPRPLLDLVELAVEQGQIVEQDVLLNDKFYSVSVRPLPEQGYLNLYGKDITERKQAEKALAESERRQREITRLLEVDQARLATILKHLPVGVWIVDEHGRLTGSNPEADRIWAGEAHLESTADYQKYVSWHPASGELLKPEEYPIAVALRTGEPVQPMETNIRRFDGSEGTILVSAVPLKDVRGQTMGVVAVNVDITERKQAEARINDLLSLNEKILNHSSVGILTYKVSGQCVFANEKVASIVGTTVDHLLMQNFHTIPSWKESGLYDLVQQAISTRAPVTSDIHLFTTFGKEVWLTIYCTTFRSKDEDHVLVSISDITERKKAEEALRTSEERFAKAFHASPNAIIISRLSDGLIMEVNEGWSTIFGQKPSEVIGHTTLEVGAYAKPEDRQTAIAQLGEKGFLRDYELQIRRKPSGEIRQVSLSAERLEIHGEECLLAIMQDITKRKQAEEYLRRFELLSEHSRDIILFMGSEDGRILEANAAAVHAYGYSREELLSLTIRDLRAGDTLSLTAEQMAQADVRGILFETTHRRKNGSTFPVEVSSQGATIDGARTLISIIRDITERKQAEQALVGSEQRLKRAQEIAHLGSWELDLINDRLTWSDEAYRIFGLKPQQFDATYESFLQAVHPDDRAAVDGAYSRSIRERRDQYEIEHRVVRHASGEVRIVHEKCEHFRDQDGQIIRSTGMVHDITERKQAEEALRESKERFRSLADSMPQLVWTALPNGMVDYYNQRYQEYREIKQVEGAAWEWASILYPDDLQPTVDAWQRSTETGEIYQIEHRAQMSDGSYRWHLSRSVPMRDESGQIVRWFGTSTDIHDLKLAEEQLKVYAERLEHSNRELEQFAFMASHDLQEPLQIIEMFGDLLLERATGLKDQERHYVDRMRNASGRMRDMVEGLLELSRITTEGRPFIPVDLSQVVSEVLYDLEGQIRRTSGTVHAEPLPTVEGDTLQLRQLLQNLIGNALKYHQPGIAPEINVHAEQRSGRVRILVKDKGIGFDQEHAERIFQPFQRLVGRSQYEGSGLGLAICRRIVERHGGEITALSKPGHGTTIIVTLPGIQDA